MKTINKTQKVKEYKVVFFADGSEIGTRNLQLTKSELWKKLKNWLNYMRENGREHPHFEITEVYHEKSLMSLFLEKERLSEVGLLVKSAKELVASYDKEDPKRSRAEAVLERMCYSLKDEFYMTADICENTVWKWQDIVSQFDKVGYLLDIPNPEVSDWTQFFENCYIREWKVEILKLVKDWNLDNQEQTFVSLFQHDYMSCKTKEQFYSAVLKWTDLIHWSPWKLEFYRYSIPQPLNNHWNDDFNDDVEDVFNSEEV